MPRQQLRIQLLHVSLLHAPPKMVVDVLLDPLRVNPGLLDQPASSRATPPPPRVRSNNLLVCGLALARNENHIAKEVAGKSGGRDKLTNINLLLECHLLRGRMLVNIVAF